MENGSSNHRRGSDSQTDRSTRRNPNGRDELNLAEFPLCCIDDRVEPGQKTLRFEDRTWDESRGEMISRQLTITGSDEYGLPTALDDEVLLGLIQLARLANFADRRVFFTRYQLLQLLYWTDEGKSYRRLEKSLNRWVGVTLYYRNAWWNRADSCWVDEKFHVLDNVTLHDREKARRCVGWQRGACSSFAWNDVIFRSFKAGNLKGIDWDFFRKLESAVAKRLYRFLDKRFFHRGDWEFDLKELAWEHIGLARTYDSANLKRKLRPAIAELEQLGFLKPMPDSGRFRKVSCGNWRAVFERDAHEQKSRTTSAGAAEPAKSLKEALVDRGVTPSAATEIVVRFPADLIQGQLEAFDWLRAHDSRRISRNPAGYLVSSINGGYNLPEEFRSRQVNVRTEVRHAAGTRRKQETAKLRSGVDDEAIERFWASFSEAERHRLETEALAAATSFQRKLLAGGGAMSAATRKSIFDAFALKMESGRGSRERSS